MGPHVGRTGWLHVAPCGCCLLPLSRADLGVTGCVCSLWSRIKNPVNESSFTHLPVKQAFPWQRAPGTLCRNLLHCGLMPQASAETAPGSSKGQQAGKEDVPAPDTTVSTQHPHTQPHSATGQVGTGHTHEVSMCRVEAGRVQPLLLK